MYSSKSGAKKQRMMFDDFVEHGHFTRSVVTRPKMDVFAGVDEDDVRLDFTAVSVDKIKEYTAKIIQKSNKVYDEIAALNKTHARLSFANVLQPEINLGMSNANMVCLCVNPLSFYTDEAVRNASTDSKKELDRYGIDVNMRKDLYDVFYRYYRYYYKNEKASLTEEECRYVEDTMRDYKKNGMHLSDTKREELKNLKSRISDLENDFMNNLNSDTTSLYFTREELKGMPESWFEDKKPNEKSQYEVTMQYPDIFPALDYIDNRELRKQLCTAFNSRVATTNMPIFNEVVALRHKKAVLLGFQSHAQLVIEDKMAKTPENVMEFLEDLSEKVTPLFDKDMEDLQKLAIQETGDEDFEIEAWDTRYFMRIHQEKVSNLNQEELKKFFPVDVVTQGLFNIYQRMLGLKFFEKKTENKWHESVKYFEVHDYNYKNGTLGEMVGAFYLDMHPRKGKYGHAAAYNFINGYQSDRSDVVKSSRLPIGTMCCNFPENGPISFEDVQTYFHEFGHIMHLLCSGRIQMPNMCGFNVEGDFVEAPSQMLENWVYEGDALKLMSKHVDTHQPIDDATIEKIRNSRIVMEGYSSKRQLVFGLFDMKIHTPPVSTQSNSDANKVFAQVYESTLGIDYPASFCVPASFSHLMSDDYSAGYYGYKWAEVISTDMYYSMFKGNPLNEHAGQHYRKTILDPGATKDAMDLVRDFLGRNPSNDNYQKFLGIDESQDQDDDEDYVVENTGSRKRVANC